MALANADDYGKIGPAHGKILGSKKKG